MTPRRRVRRVAGAAVVVLAGCAVLAAGAVVPAAAGAPVGAVGVERLAGADRYATSLAVARAYAAERGGRLDAVVLVSGRSWPDAVTAAGLAGRLDGPVLLVGPGGLSGEALEFLGAAGASELVAVGSESALPSAALASARSVDADIERISGRDRYEASAAVARRIVADGHALGLARTVVLASGEVFVDAMVAGTFAARGGHPVLLTPPDTLDPAVAAFIAADLVERVVIMGGPAAVSAGVQAELEGRGKHVARLEGATRFETAVAAADWVSDGYSWSAGGECFNDEVVALTTARAPYDAFTAGPLLARMCAPLLLSDPDGVPAATAAWIGPNTDRLLVLGGPAAVSHDAVTDLVEDRQVGARAQAEDYMVQLVNELRAEYGEAPLRHHGGLRRVARGWSVQMPEDGRFGHNPAWISEYPVGWLGPYGENVAREYVGGTLSEAVEAAHVGLRDSPGHFANLVNGAFTDVGVGIVLGERKIMVTQNFSAYPDEPVEAPPAKPRIGARIWDDRILFGWWAAASDLPITHWQVTHHGLRAGPAPFAWGYTWHNPPTGTHTVSAAACNAAGCSPPSEYAFTVDETGQISADQ